jgi:hypothetical protein
MWLTASLLTSFTACTGNDTDNPSFARRAANRSAFADSESPTDYESDNPALALARASKAAIKAGSESPARLASPVIKLGASGAQLETIAASRGGVALDVSVVGSELTSPGVITTVRTSLVETIETLPDATEQSWYFEQAPGRTGDLVVVVGVTGLDYVSTSAEGLLLHRPGELDVRYSHGFWLESNGTRTPIPATYDRGRILLTVPATLVARSTYPALLDPKIIVTPVIILSDSP